MKFESFGQMQYLGLDEDRANSLLTSDNLVLLRVLE